MENVNERWRTAHVLSEKIRVLTSKFNVKAFVFYYFLRIWIQLYFKLNTECDILKKRIIFSESNLLHPFDQQQFFNNIIPFFKWATIHVTVRKYKLQNVRKHFKRLEIFILIYFLF